MRGSLPEPYRSLVRLAVPGRLDALEPARQALIRALEHQRLQLSERTLYRLELVLEEVLMNVQRHGFKGDPERLSTVDLGLADASVLLQFEDDGQPFDPTQPLPEPVSTLAESSDGGRGLRLLQRSASALDYERVDGRNRLRVVISLEPQNP